MQRKPDLFPTLRSFIDSRIRDGEHTAQFLILGSASPALLKQSSESLAGRIQYLELNPFSVAELANLEDESQDLRKLWLNGGYPKSALALDDEASFAWRGAYISTFVERDVQLLGSRIPPETLRALWSLLAWQNAQPINFSRIAANLGISYKTVQRYIDTLESAFILRRLRPWNTNRGKRLVKAPKIYLRDSGLTHRMLRISSYDDLLGHPTVGSSWEAFAVENILRNLSDYWEPSYYRTGSGAEIDLVLEGPQNAVRALEIKFSSAPRVSRGFHEGCQAIGATEKFVIYPGSEQFPLARDAQAIGLREFLRLPDLQSSSAA